jgi:hypothetical protein
VQPQPIGDGGVDKLEEPQESWRFRAGTDRVDLGRLLLLLGVFLNDGLRCSVAGCREVGRGREVPVDEVGVDTAGEFFAEVMGGDAFEAVDEGGDREFGRVADEEADVVVFAVELAEFGAGPRAYAADDLPPPGEHLPVLDVTPVSP